MKALKHIVNWIVWSLMAITLAAMTLIRVPAVQTWLGRRVAHELSQVLGIPFIEKKDELTEEQLALFEARKAARKEKNWAESDRIRDELKAQGILVEDTPQGMKWKRA